MTSTWTTDAIITNQAMSVPAQSKIALSNSGQSLPVILVDSDTKPIFPSQPPKKTTDSPSPKPPPPARPIASEIAAPRTQHQSSDSSSDRITKQLGNLLHNPCLEEHCDKLAVCSKINELRRSTVRCALGRASFHSDLSELEWRQLDAALKSSPRVLDILRRVREDQRSMMRDTIEFRKGVAFLDRVIDDMPLSEKSAQTALRDVHIQLTCIDKVKAGTRV